MLMLLNWKFETNENLKNFLLVYLYVYHLIFLPMVMHMHIKLMNTLGNWLNVYTVSIHDLSEGCVHFLLQLCCGFTVVRTHWKPSSLHCNMVTGNYLFWPGHQTGPCLHWQSVSLVSCFYLTAKLLHRSENRNAADSALLRGSLYYSILLKKTGELKQDKSLQKSKLTILSVNIKKCNKK